MVETFPLHNIHPHQMEFMKAFEQQGGIAFFLIFYTAKNLFYYMPYDQMAVFWKRAEDGGRGMSMPSAPSMRARALWKSSS